MSFTPLPKKFLETLDHVRLGRSVELGCGDGRFCAVLNRHGLRPWRLDRRHPRLGTVADVVADARALPLADASLDLVISANLLRQLWPLPDGRPVPLQWQHSLQDQGRLYIFEDEPLVAPASARNYRDLQLLLARLDPPARRPLLPRAVFARHLGRTSARSGRWHLGRLRNNLWSADVEAVLRWLVMLDPHRRGEAGRLWRAIRKHGLSYGKYWWACWSRDGNP
jgi:hypothetical protein